MKELVRVSAAALGWMLGWAWSWISQSEHPWFALLMLVSVLLALPRGTHAQDKRVIRYLGIIAGFLVGAGSADALQPYTDQIVIALSRSVMFMVGATMFFAIRLYKVAAGLQSLKTEQLN